MKWLAAPHVSPIRRLAASTTVAGALLLCALPAQAQSDKFEFHGFLNQAWATSDFVSGPLTDALGSPQESETLLGIPEDGTFEYRNLAIQFRYAISDKDNLVVQLSNQATGFSPIDNFRDEIELDWAFYERRLTPVTSLKVGRVQIPLGIFNEIRDVGTILPFFRPSYAMYLEGSFTSETVDGLALAHRFFGESDWGLDADVYLGEYDSFEVSPIDPSDVRGAEVEDAYGIQLWLNTPLDGLRVGSGYHSRTVTGGFEGLFRRVGEEQEIDDIWFSVDGVFARFIARAEYRNFDASFPSPLGPASVDPDGVTVDLTAWYAQVGWLINDRFHVYLQHEEQNTDQTSADLVRPFEFDNRIDDGISLNYFVSPQLVVKAEYHQVELEFPAAVPVFTPAGPRIGGAVLGADDGNYFIASLAVSF